jgi:hypothetical protein
MGAGESLSLIKSFLKKKILKTVVPQFLILLFVI